MFVPQGTVVWSDQNFNHEVKSNDNKSKQNIKSKERNWWVYCWRLIGEADSWSHTGPWEEQCYLLIVIKYYQSKGSKIVYTIDIEDNIKSNYMDQTRVLKQPDLGEIDGSVLYFTNSPVELMIWQKKVSLRKRKLKNSHIFYYFNQI